MDQIFFCVHEKCNCDSRLLMTMADVPKHNDKLHKVIQFKELKAYVNQKYIDGDINKMQKITAQEKAVKDNIIKSLKEVKDKLDLFELNEIKKMPSLQQVLDYVWTIKKTENLKDVTHDLLKGLVEFQVERIPKYATVISNLDERILNIKTEILNMLKAQSHDMQIAPLNIVKYTWSDTFKAGNYMIKDDTRKDIESTTSFLGWSFACTQQLMGSGKRHELKLEILEQDAKPLNQSQIQNDKKHQFSFAIGITQSKQRLIKGYDQQDLSMIGHGFYVLRSDGLICHNTDKNLNWKQTGAFIPEFGIILLKFDASEGDLTLEQGKNKYTFKIEKNQTDGYLFCAHLKGCKGKIIDQQ